MADDEPDFLDATLKGENANSYLTIAEADDLMHGYESDETWGALEAEDQARLLIQGTRLIDRYPMHGWGPKSDSRQRLAFPRSCEAEDAIPEGVKTALMEFVHFRLEDEDGSRRALKELQAEGVTSSSILGQSASFGADPSELPAGTRRELDRIVSTYWPKAVKNREYDGSTDEEGTSLFG